MITKGMLLADSATIRVSVKIDFPFTREEAETYVGRTIDLGIGDEKYKAAAYITGVEVSGRITFLVADVEIPVWLMP